MADIKLTPEMERALLGLTPFSRDAVYKFTPNAFLIKNESGEYIFPEEIRPIYHLKALSRAAKKEMVRKGMAVSKDDSSVDMDDIKEIMRPFIVNIERLFDRGKMEFIEFTKDSDGYISKDLFHAIPTPVLNEVTSELMTISGLKEPEVLGLK